MNFYPPGARIAGRYEVASRPLRGGMGIVYLCEDLDEKRPVALKTFRPELLPDRSARDRFLREGTHWVDLGAHPHIVRCYEVVHIGDGREVYLALELVPKEQWCEDASLRAWLTPGVPLPVEQALLFALQVARGMQHAVKIIPGFVHRDLKPENLLVGADRLPGKTAINRLRVTDFGLAVVVQAGGIQTIDLSKASGAPDSLGRTRLTHGIAGTPLYMAPEQWRGQDVCLQTDIYALGCILYEMVTGQRAVEGPDLETLRRAHCEGQQRPLPSGVAAEVQEVVARCLAVAPGERYRSWAAVEAAVGTAYEVATAQPVPAQVSPAAPSQEERVAAGWSHCAIGYSFLDIGNVTQALDHFQRALTAGQAEVEQRLESDGLNGLGTAYMRLGNMRQAIRCYVQAQVILRKIGHLRGEGAVLSNLGGAYIELGETQQAIGYYEQALAIAYETGNRHGEGLTLGCLGLAYLNLGYTKQAIEYYKKHLAIARETNDRQGEGTVLSNLGNAYADLGNVQWAIRYFEQALTIAREVGDRRGESAALCNLGLAYTDMGDTQGAVELYEQALAIDRETGDRRSEGVDLGCLGSAYLYLGDARRAIAYYDLCLALARETGNRLGEGNTFNNMGNAYRNLGDIRQAAECYEQALKVAREVRDRRREGNALGNLGNVYADLGDNAAAIAFFRQARLIRQHTGDVDGLAFDSFNMAVLYAQQGELQRALPLAREAAEIWKRISSPYSRQADQLVAYLQGSRTTHGG